MWGGILNVRLKLIRLEGGWRPFCTSGSLSNYSTRGLGFRVNVDVR